MLNRYTFDGSLSSSSTLILHLSLANKTGRWNQGFVLVVPQGTPHLVVTVWQEKPYGTSLGEALIPVERITAMSRGDLLKKENEKKMWVKF